MLSGFYEREASLDCLENDRKGACVDVQTNSVPDLLVRANRNPPSHWPITAPTPSARSICNVHRCPAKRIAVPWQKHDRKLLGELGEGEDEDEDEDEESLGQGWNRLATPPSGIVRDEKQTRDQGRRECPNNGN